MSKAYTGRGDAGYTRTFDGRMLPKDNPIIVAGGKIDSLLSALDFAKRYNSSYASDLGDISTKLWLMSGELSGAARAVKPDDVKTLEQKTDALGQALDKFIRFMTKGALWLNECRTRSREAEIALLPIYRTKTISNEFYTYMNRLSSYFFMLAYKSEM